MRERLARALAALSGLLIVLAAVGFGVFQNQPGGGEEKPPSPAETAAGRAAYEAQGCALCHAIGGEGDPEHPLDGIGARLSGAQIRLRIAPPDDMKPQFPVPVFELKQAFREMPEDEMGALVRYLESLR